MIRPLTVVMCAFLSVPLVLAAPVGRVTALEGEVSIWRDAKPLDAGKLAEGLELETDDLLVTGSLGKLELLLDRATGVGARLRLGASSQVILDVTAAKREQTATIELLGGSLSAVVPNLNEASRLVIQTNFSRLSTRGATFSVTAALGGELAIAASTGRVVCLVDEADYLAEPGSVVVVSPRPREARSLPVNSTTLDSWSQNWKLGMDADIRNRALATFKFFGAEYLQKSGEFQRAWERWLREGRTSKDKALLEHLTVNLRQAGLPLQRNAFRLAELRGLLAKGVVNETQEIAQLLTLKDFYRQFDRDANELSARFAQMRQLHKAVLVANNGEFPQPGDIPVVTRESPYFN